MEYLRHEIDKLTDDESPRLSDTHDETTKSQASPSRSQRMPSVAVESSPETITHDLPGNVSVSPTGTQYLVPIAN